ncbi:hypothetical protein JQC67_02660 [Aurantibacter crassamenti]|uniref:hypothetical protein n=1 Tax=Aurantibacter crassamenti TaxID=1837375 RepID=UPI00193A0072|nr:hypothetical protein [Aurantibacter crassamenti]MBM1105032.1 hypothetical protein [Aurantibacter crassamenti]
MKRIVIALMVIMINSLFFSCTKDSVADTNDLYNIHATEGDDGNPPPPPPGGGI